MEPIRYFVQLSCERIKVRRTFAYSTIFLYCVMPFVVSVFQIQRHCTRQYPGCVTQFCAMIQLAGQPICSVEHATSLGLIIDDQLSWSNHIKELCRKIYSAIGALRRIRSLIPQSTEEQIYNALIQPYFDYCAPVWHGLTSYLSEKLQKLQNRAARLFCKPTVK